MGSERDIFSDNPKGVIFDMDGVIFDSESVWRDVTFEVNPRFGIEFDDAYRQGLCGMDEGSIRARLRADFPHADVDAYRDTLVPEAKGRLVSGMLPKPGFMEFLELCRSKGMRAGLATSSSPDRARKMFRAIGLDPEVLFDAVTFGREVERSKPDPQIFLLAASRLGLSPDSCIVMEDSLNGLRAAYDGGFQPVMMRDLIEPDDWVRDAGILVFDGFDELLPPKRYRNRPEEYDLDRRGPSHAVFMGYSDPTFSITARLDVTNLFDWCKGNHRSFFIEFLYLVSTVSNGIENFRLRIMDGKPVLFDSIDPSYVIIRGDDTICTSNTEYTPDREDFFTAVRMNIDRMKSPDTEPVFNGNGRLDLLFVSCTPWLDFVTIKNPYDLKSPDSCSIPRITWGKVVREGGGWKITVDVSAHHALMDGYHMALFFNGLQGRIDDFEGGNGQ